MVNDPRLGNRLDHVMTSDAPKALNLLGQSLWLDDISRDLLDRGTLARYTDTRSITGLTSNPTIFDHAISRGAAYDDEIDRQVAAGRSGEDLFFALAMQNLVRAAGLFAPIHARAEPKLGHDASTNALIAPYRRRRA